MQFVFVTTVAPPTEGFQLVCGEALGFHGTFVLSEVLAAR